MAVNRVMYRNLGEEHTATIKCWCQTYSTPFLLRLHRDKEQKKPKTEGWDKIISSINTPKNGKKRGIPIEENKIQLSKWNGKERRK